MSKKIKVESEQEFFCRLCGSKMVLQQKGKGFDTKTGKAKVERVYSCPKDRFPHIMNHSNIKFWEDGKPYDMAESYDW